MQCCLSIANEIKIPSRSLTVRPWKIMVGRRSFPIGKVTFQGLGRVKSNQLESIGNVSTSPHWCPSLQLCYANLEGFIHPVLPHDAWSKHKNWGFLSTCFTTFGQQISLNQLQVSTWKNHGICLKRNSYMSSCDIRWASTPRGGMLHPASATGLSSFQYSPWCLSCSSNWICAHHWNSSPHVGNLYSWTESCMSSCNDQDQSLSKWYQRT